MLLGVDGTISSFFSLQGMLSVTVSATLYLTGTSSGKGTREGLVTSSLSFSKAREASLSAQETGYRNTGLGQLSKLAKVAHSPEKGGAAQGANRESSGNCSSHTTLFPAPPPWAQQLLWLPCLPADLRLEGDCGGSLPGAEQCLQGWVSAVT